MRLPVKLLPRKVVLSRLFAVGIYPPECLRGVIGDLKDFTEFGESESGGAGRERAIMAVPLQLLSAVALGNDVRAISFANSVMTAFFFTFSPSQWEN